MVVLEYIYLCIYHPFQICHLDTCLEQTRSYSLNLKVNIIFVFTIYVQSICTHILQCEDNFKEIIHHLTKNILVQLLP